MSAVAQPRWAACRLKVARHERSTVRGSATLVLDHYLEVLVRKPGALPGATALVQARRAGVFTTAHDAFWAAARRAHGDADGTRELVEVLLLHRYLTAADVVDRLTAALTVGRSARTSWPSKPAGSPTNHHANGDTDPAGRTRRNGGGEGGVADRTPFHRPHRRDRRATPRRAAAALDPRLCAAIGDRLTFGANIIETGTHSYRLAHTLAHR